jgi:beta-glucanase (GH16 family)
MRKAALLVGPLALAAAGLALAAGGDHRASSARPRLILREEFAGRRLNRHRWNTCHWWATRGCTIASNHELEWYLPGQLRVRHGIARLVAERRTVHGSDGRVHPFASGMISSGPRPDSHKPKFAFRYGRAEIRMRVPHGRGLWAAFWLLPANRRSKPEIDVMEIVGQRPTVVEMHLHYRGRGGGERERGAKLRQRSLGRGWHRFGIDWRPRRLAWLVDGVVRWRLSGDAVPRRPMYLVANLAVGGDLPGAPGASTRFPSALRIDWVRVWR